MYYYHRPITDSIASAENRLQIGRNRADRTSRDTLFADDTTRSGKVELEGVGYQIEGFCRTYARAQATIDTDILIDIDFLIGSRNLNALRSHPLNGRIEFVNIARQFDYQFPNLIGGNLRTDNIGSDIKIFSQPIGYWHLNRPFGEGQSNPFFHNRKG
jgi:hypothetical protein